MLTTGLFSVQALSSKTGGSFAGPALGCSPILCRSAEGSAMSEPGHWFESDPLSFKRAVFYEIQIAG
jgi:hypothetical protein